MTCLKVNGDGKVDWEGQTCLFIVPMALVTPFMACAIELLDFRVCILRDTAWMLARINMCLDEAGQYILSLEINDVTALRQLFDFFSGS